MDSKFVPHTIKWTAYHFFLKQAYFLSILNSFSFCDSSTIICALFNIATGNLSFNIETTS